MSVIRHWTARSPAGLWQIVDDGTEANLAGFRRAGWTVEGPFVPADQLTGAVERFAERLAEDGAFDRWMRLAHLDRRNGTHEARDEIATFLRGGQ